MPKREVIIPSTLFDPGLESARTGEWTVISSETEVEQAESAHFHFYRKRRLGVKAAIAGMTSLITIVSVGGILGAEPARADCTFENGEWKCPWDTTTTNEDDEEEPKPDPTTTASTPKSTKPPKTNPPKTNPPGTDPPAPKPTSAPAVVTNPTTTIVVESRPPLAQIPMCDLEVSVPAVVYESYNS